MKNMGQALYLLHLRQREQLVGALSEWQQIHEFLFQYFIEKLARDLQDQCFVLIF